MSTTAVRTEEASAAARVGQVDMKLEVITLPVSDIDLAKSFYGGLGWRLDADFKDGDERAVQLTPPGSQCSIHLTDARQAPGSAQGMFLVVSDIQAARDEAAEARRRSGRGIPFRPGVPAPSAEWSAGSRLTTRATARMRRSRTRNGTAGCCRKSRRGSQGVWRATRRIRRSETWRRRCGGRRLRTASTRSAPASATRTGRPGTRRTCCRSRPEPSRRFERIRR